MHIYIEKEREILFSLAAHPSLSLYLVVKSITTAVMASKISFDVIHKGLLHWVLP
jgi:hypothetical protein